MVTIVGVLTVGMLLAPAGAWAQGAASTPAKADAAPDLQWAQQYFDGIDQSLGSLDSLRGKGTPPDDVAKTLQRGLSLLNTLGERLDNLQKAATRPSRKEDAAAFDEAFDVCRCRAEISRGQLYMQAAAALPQPSSARADYAAKAIETFQALRVDYRQLRLGCMGYILESRAQRLLGKPEAAAAALEPLLQIVAKEKDPVLAAMRQMVIVEQMEVQLLTDPPAAADTATRRLSSNDLKDMPQWQGQVNWVLARARLCTVQRQARLDQPPGSPAVQQCAAMLRDGEVARVAPPYDRLKCLVDLEALSQDRKLLTQQELIAWAEATEQSGGDGTAIYERVLQGRSTALSPTQMLQFCGSLYRRQQYERAAAAAQTLLERDSVDQPVHQAALRLRVASLLAMHKKSSLPAGRLSDLLDALLALAGADSPQAIRRDALMQWVSLLPPSTTHSSVLQVLDKKQDLVAGNAYLLYTRAVHSWAILARKPLNPPSDADKKAATAILDDAAESQRLALDKGMAGRCVLLRAEVIGRGPASDARAALALLKEHQQDIDGDKELSAQALSLRVRLMVDMGLMDAALEEFAKSSSQPAAGSSDVLLRLAEALAARYASADAAWQSKIQEQVLGLCNRAIEQSVVDAAAYRQTSRRAAEILAGVRALGDAHRIAARLLADPAIAGDKAAGASLSLLLAEILMKDSKPQQALAALETLAKTAPASLDLETAKGRCLMMLQQHRRAAESFRIARKLANPGSAAWCELTLNLSESLSAQGEHAAAADIIRVAAALYPEFGGPTLKARCTEALTRYSSKATTQSSSQ